MEKLSPRLEAIAKYVKPNSKVLDVGTDHAYLPVFLIHKGICSRVIAGDLNAKPLSSAHQTVLSYGLEQRIELRLGNGLEIIQSGEADMIIIAGMGGGTIAEILAAAPEKLASVQRLILQPMNASGILRRWLRHNGWSLVQETLVEENGRLYIILVAEPGMMADYEDVAMDLGPLLLAEKPPLLPAYLIENIEHDTRISRQLSLASTPEALAKRDYLTRKLQFMQKVVDKIETTNPDRFPR